MGSVIFLALLFLAMWVFVVLPQQRRQRMHRALVSSLSVGDAVMTTSGIYGTVTDLEGELASLEIADGVVIRIARQAILRQVGPELEPEADEEPETVAELTGDAADPTD